MPSIKDKAPPRREESKEEKFTKRDFDRLLSLAVLEKKVPGNVVMQQVDKVLHAERVVLTTARPVLRSLSLKAPAAIHPTDKGNGKKNCGAQ